jgi:HD-GYP domain-containing protein (c-di-GMP phosphodiesterase class II)
VTDRTTITSGLPGLADFWREQAQLYEAELRHARQVEQATRAALDTAQAQLLRYAEDVRSTYHAERARRQEIQRAYLETIRMLAAAVEARDPYTGNHLERVTHYSLVIATTLGWRGDSLRQVEMGAILHDIGKINIHDAVLRKPEPLSVEEWAHMRTHPEIGSRILGGISFLKPIIPYVRHHHERFDGTGYPDGLRGQDIPIGGRLIAVADTFDAMTTTRSYRGALPVSVALAELRAQAMHQFDPEIVDAFLRAYEHGDIVIGPGATPLSSRGDTPVEISPGAVADPGQDQESGTSG